MDVRLKAKTDLNPVVTLQWLTEYKTQPEISAKSIYF